MPVTSTALITGADAAVGTEFCRQLAARCELIIAVGSHREPLQALATELAGQTQLQLLTADLATREGLTRVIETLRQQAPLDYLVNNAGYFADGDFLSGELQSRHDMITVHIDAALALCRAALPAMRERARGHIVNVSSLLAFAPHTPTAAVYGAGKAFLNHFSEALQVQVAECGIKVQSLCPGYTYSAGDVTDDGFVVPREPTALWMEAAEVVRISLQALPGEQVIVIPGDNNRTIARQWLQRQLDSL